MNALKHFNWQAQGFGRGRIAVRVSDDSIEIAQLAGNAPPANPFFLAALLTENEYAACANAHARRVNPWCIERRIGMSGAADIRLRVLENEALGDAPVKNVLHISMNSKLNQGYSGWAGDFYAILENWPAEWAERDKAEWESWGGAACLSEAPVFQPSAGWNYPAVDDVQDEYNSSAVLALLDSIDVSAEKADEYPADEIEIVK